MMSRAVSGHNQGHNYPARLLLNMPGKHQILSQATPGGYFTNHSAESSHVCNLSGRKKRRGQHSSGPSRAPVQLLHASDFVEASNRTRGLGHEALAMEAVMVTLGDTDMSWENIRHRFSSPHITDVLYSINHFDIMNLALNSEDKLRAMKAICDDEDFNPRRLGTKCNVMGILCSWVIQTYQAAQVRRALTVYDLDNSGTLDKEEFKEMMQTKGDHPLNDEQFEEVFKECDKDGDGEISLEELADWLEEHDD